ncbi:efflux transporter [Fomitopsis serialis]|uniref:efflux transporter n=1 Tax=Fomitopsis serialis TaxID=139415 RepID=UPI002007C517|nr:efflux transporter [Neoantrodia serialis]KAH9925490.1 efflux transporter [Neoantrodia serialis]
MGSQLPSSEFPKATPMPDATERKAQLQDPRDPEALDRMPDGEPAPRPLSRLQTVGLIATCTTAMLLNTSLNTAVAIALPTMGNDLNIPQYRLQWVISAYTLSSGCLLLFFGRLADLYGRKKAFLAGITVLGVLSLGCGFAQNEITIDVLRGVQGLGSAAAIPASLGILAHSFPPSKTRSVAFATFAAGAPVGAAIGSAIGGVLTQLTEKTWRSTFWFMAAARRLVGAFLVTAGLVLIVFVLSDGTIAPDGWKTGYIIALLIIGVLPHFLERKLDAHSLAWWTPPPLMRVSLWGRARGKLAVTLCLALLEYGGFMSFCFWIQLYYQDYQGLNPVLTMVRLLPMFVTGIVANIIVALFVGRVPLVVLVTMGMALTGVANLLFALINPAATYWAFGFPAAILSVFGADFVFAAGTLFVAKVCLPHEQSVGGALFQTMTQLGASFGLAITTIVYDSELKKVSAKDGVIINVDGTNAPAEAQLSAYKDAFWTACAIAMFGAVLSVLILRGAGIVGHQKGSEHGSTISGDTIRDEKAQAQAEKKV